jgi:hypothetical protein
MTDMPVRPPLDAAVARALSEFSDIIVTQMSEADIPRVRELARPFSTAELTMHGAFDREERILARPSDGTDLAIVG